METGSAFRTRRCASGHRSMASTLRESRPEELARQIDRAISGWLATPLSPGEVRRFTAIVPVDQLPDRSAQRVLLEAEQRREALSGHSAGAGIGIPTRVDLLLVRRHVDLVCARKAGLEILDRLAEAGSDLGQIDARRRAR